MNIEKSGIIIKTTNNKDCASFYKNIMGLQIIIENNFLTCFDCNGHYIMIEPLLETATPAVTGNFVLRFNVDDIMKHKDELEHHGICGSTPILVDHAGKTG